MEHIFQNQLLLSNKIHKQAANRLSRADKIHPQVKSKFSAAIVLFLATETFLSSSEQDYQRAASKTFQVSEIETFLGLDDLEGNYWMIRKAIAAVGNSVAINLEQILSLIFLPTPLIS